MTNQIHDHVASAHIFLSIYSDTDYSSTLCDHATPAAVLFTNGIISEDQRSITNKLAHQEKVIFPVLS